MEADTEVFYLTLAGNLIIFTIMVLLFDKIRVWRGDEE
jgi:hypothetical protein